MSRKIEATASVPTASSVGPWSLTTVAKLFEIGPAEYTPGTKMPEQRIGRAEDRDALVTFLERATK